MGYALSCDSKEASQALLSNDLESTGPLLARWSPGFRHPALGNRGRAVVVYLLPIAILDPDVFALLQLFAIFKPFVGRLRVSSSCLTFQ